ncbi:MAG: VWA domain-containing protein [Burkholderiaceae bacterium]|nr:VWA domain-containing protein [Burkholderiaceae bacterium]
MIRFPSFLSSESSVMRSADGTTLPLVRVDVDACARGLSHAVTFRQHWRNAAESDIEAIYTFPLPSAAVLLGLRVELAGQQLHGVVVARGDAEQRYEDAVEKGDSAVLLERTANGMYTVSLGNLKAGETAIVEVRYAQLLAFDGGRVRLTIPTVIAPRYGDPLAAGLPAHAVPESSLDAEYRATVRIRAEGALAKATVSCPSHDAEFSRDADALVVTLSGAMDRDFVVTFDDVLAEQMCVVARNDLAPAQEPASAPLRERNSARTTPPESEHVLVAGFTPPRVDGPAASLRLKILVDCSGSMAGDSIDAAKRALMQLLMGCDVCDTISLARFGSGFEAGPADFDAWTEDVFADAMQWLMTMNADMGGTVMGPALAAVFARGGSGAADADVLLITDGEIWDDDALLANARASEQRVFVIAVGAAPAEGFLTRLARETGGAIEFVTAGEDLVRAIAALGARLRQTRARDIQVHWPTKPVWTLALPDAIFGGDTVYLIAGFDALPVGSVELAWNDSAPRTLAVGIPTAISENDAIARIAAARRCDTLISGARARYAERHQIVTDATSMVLVLERADAQRSAGDLKTIKLPQMLAAGWGGAGSVQLSTRPATKRVRRSDSFSGSGFSALESPATWKTRRTTPDLNCSFDEIPAFLARQDSPAHSIPDGEELRGIVVERLGGIAAMHAAPERDLERFAVLLAAWLRNRRSAASASIDDLRALEDDMPQALWVALEVFSECGVSEERATAEVFRQLADLYPAAGIQRGGDDDGSGEGRRRRGRPSKLTLAIRSLLAFVRETAGSPPGASAPPQSQSNLPGRSRRLRYGV